MSSHMWPWAKDYKRMGIIATEFGEVTSAPLMERSGHTAYSALAKSLEKATLDSHEPGGASPPSVVANVISQAVKSSKPKTRYAAGKLAKPLLLMRQWLPDRLFDKIILSTAS